MSWFLTPGSKTKAEEESCEEPLVRVGLCVPVCVPLTHTLTGRWHRVRNTHRSQRREFPVREEGAGARPGWCSAAAQLGQEVGHAEEDPHHQQVGAERQQGQRVQQAGVQPQVPHRQQAAQVLLDHPLPRPDAAGSPGRRRRGRRGGVEQQNRLEDERRSNRAGGQREGGGESKQKARRREERRWRRAQR